MLRPSSRRLSTALATSLCLTGLSSAASSQVLRGRVTDAAGEPVMGAYVLLVDEAREGVRGVLTDRQGFYLLRSPGPGRFLLRAEMIGRRSVDSRPLDVAAGDTLIVDLTLPPAPVALDAIDVAAARRCEVRPGADGETHMVWEEARKALAIEAATRRENLFRFSVEHFERELDASGDRVVSERTRYSSLYSGAPFRAMPAGHLATRGFLDERPDGTWLYGPNAEVLLSDPFLDTHCMFLRRDPARPGMIALAFEPVPGRDVTDIAGELWLDQRTAELRSLIFRYTRLPNSLARGDYGGESAFQRLPGGAWIVYNWLIRTPIVQLVRGDLRGRQYLGEVTTGFHVEGAEVLLIEDRNGNVVYRSRSASTSEHRIQDVRTRKITVTRHDRQDRRPSQRSSR